MISLFAAFTTQLERAGVPYMITGSVAGMVYGEPRLTHGVDIVVPLDERSIIALEAAFPREQFYCPPVEVIRIEAQRRQPGDLGWTPESGCPSTGGPALGVTRYRA